MQRFQVKNSNAINLLGINKPTSATILLAVGMTTENLHMSIPTKSAAILLGYTCIAVSLVMAKGQRTDQKIILGDVATTFRSISRTLRSGQALSVKFVLENISAKPVHFRFSGNFAEHIEVYEAKGKKVSLREGAPISESPAVDIILAANEKRVITEEVQVFRYYALLPGMYRVRLIYDRRLLPNQVRDTNFGNENSFFILWSAQDYPFEVVR